MKYKTFNYKKYKGCSFEVGNYKYNPQSMSIIIVDSEGEERAIVTINMPDYFYSPNTATIKNYSENSGMTKFLNKLGVIETIYTKRRANLLAQPTETIDFCAINIDKLKKYSSKFNYEFTY